MANRVYANIRAKWEALMICETCHGQQVFPPCPDCGGCGIGHCCDGLIECELITPPNIQDDPPSDGRQRQANKLFASRTNLKIND
jgi:hypothetical protein